jgi:hypothetical protein
LQIFNSLWSVARLHDFSLTADQRLLMNRYV